MSPWNWNEKGCLNQKKVLPSTASIPTPDIRIIFTKAPKAPILQKHLSNMNNFYLIKILRIGAQKTRIQKTYEINVGQDSLKIDFLGSKFDWLELLIVYDNSDKHSIIYDSYNTELAAKAIKSVKLSNFTEIYSLVNEKNMT